MNNLKKYKEDGGNLNVKDPFGNSPIFLAISLGNKDATNFLIDSNCDLTVTDMRGRGFLHYAAEFGPPSLILRFFQKKARKCIKSIYQSVSIACQPPFLFSCLGDTGRQGQKTHLHHQP